MSTVLDSYHRLAGEAFEAWDRLIAAPDNREAQAAVAGLEDRLDDLESEFPAIAAADAAFQPGEWPAWLVEMADGDDTDDGGSDRG